MHKTIFIDARWDGEIILGEELLNELKKRNTTSVALFASVQFLNLDKVKEQLKKHNITILTTKAKRTHVPIQILGCDAYEDSFEENIIEQADTVLYIGDGMFHPKALLIAQYYQKTIKDVLIWDPVANTMRIITKETIQKQKNRTKANLTKYLAAKTIGILITTKPGQQYLNQALKLKEKLEKENKQIYLFLGDTLNPQLLENYPFVGAWVNTACPRIGSDDITTIPKPLINIKEAFDAGKALEQLN